jgi:ATP-binding cassette subfamily C protein LapB
MVSVFIVVAGVYMIDAGLLTMGGLIACVLLSGRAMAPLSQVRGIADAPQPEPRVAQASR